MTESTEGPESPKWDPETVEALEGLIDHKERELRDLRQEVRQKYLKEVEWVKVVCWDCQGTGAEWIGDPDSDEECFTCGGSGWLAEVKFDGKRNYQAECELLKSINWEKVE